MLIVIEKMFQVKY